MALSIFLAILISKFEFSNHANIKNVNVTRALYTDGIKLHESLRIKVKNTGQEKVDHYILNLPKTRAERLSFIKASYKNGTKINVESYLTSKQPHAKIHAPILPNSVESIGVIMAFTRALFPLHEKRAQKEQHEGGLKETSRFFTPYFTESQSTKITTAKGVVIKSATGVAPEKKRTQSLNFGPFERSPAVDSYKSDISVIFKGAVLFKYAKKANKTVIPSFFGSTRVIESYEVENSGSALSGGYSTLDTRGQNSFRVLKSVLPPTATDLEVRDAVGLLHKVSLTPSKDGHTKDLMVTLRYPVMGGWSSSFQVSYSLPTGHFIHQSGQSYAFRSDSELLFSELPVDEYSLSLVLPLGAKNWIRSTKGGESFEAEHFRSKYFHYLDFKGRDMASFKASNFLEEQNSEVEISFEYNKLFLLAKPALICAYICVGIVSMLMFVSILEKFSGEKTKPAGEDSKSRELPRKHIAEEKTAKKASSPNEKISRLLRELVVKSRKTNYGKKSLIQSSNEIVELGHGETLGKGHTETIRILRKINNKKGRKEICDLLGRIKLDGKS